MNKPRAKTKVKLFVWDGVKYIPAIGLFPYQYIEDVGFIRCRDLGVELETDLCITSTGLTNRYEKLHDIASKILKSINSRYTLVNHPVASFDKHSFKDLPKEERVVSYEPSFDEEGNMIEIPDLSLEPLRFGGGHYTLQWLNQEVPEKLTLDHFNNCNALAKKLAQSPFTQPRTLLEKWRHRYFGHSSSFRPTKYGIEITSPSNSWARTRNIREGMFNSMDSLFNKSGIIK